MRTASRSPAPPERVRGPQQQPAWAKLLSQPGEPGERRADARAAAVLGGAGPGPPAGASASLLHRMPTGAPAIVADQVGGGRPLRAQDATFFESRFGTGFGQVRIHDDPAAATLADAADAHAVTVGSHVFFGAGEYHPGTARGTSLLAHELAHVVHGAGGASELRLWRKPKSEVTLGEPEINPADPPNVEEFVRLEVTARGMDHAARMLAVALARKDDRNNVFIGLHPKFLKVYDKTGKSLGKVALKEGSGVTFRPGVYLEGPQGLVAFTVSTLDPNRLGLERDEQGRPVSVIGQRPFNAEEKAKIAEEQAKAQAEGRQPAAPPTAKVSIKDLVTDEGKVRSLVGSVPKALVLYFVPTYVSSTASQSKKRGTSESAYGSPLEGDTTGPPANAPPWPVTVEGPKLAPLNSNPTFSAKVDWTANANYTLASQVISQVGETIHYRWELFDITAHAKKQIAADIAHAKERAAGAKQGGPPLPATGATRRPPEKSPLDQKIDDLTRAKRGEGTDVTGMGGANREFRREFEDWWKDTKKAAKGTVDPSGDTVGERLSNAAANRMALELSHVSLMVTALGATLRWLADLFAGPRLQQEIPLGTEGIFLVRVITTPAVNEDREGNPIIRPPSVNAKVVEVTPIDRVVQESLDEPDAQLAELQSQIDSAVLAGNTSRAEYLRGLLAEATERMQGSPLTLLTKQRDAKQKELDQFRKDYPTLSDYSRAHAVDVLNDQITLYERHEAERTRGATNLGAAKRLNATLISEVTAEQYPLLLTAGPMAMVGDKHQWMISDVTNRDADAFIGLGDTPSAALRSALRKFGGKAAYGRGRIGVRAAGLGLEVGAPAEMLEDSAPTDWALAEKRIDDLVATLAALGLIVTSAGTAGALIGAGVAAARLIKRWQEGTLRLDDSTFSDVLAVLGGFGAAGQVIAGLRVEKFGGTLFALTKEGTATEAQLAKAATALSAAKQVAKGVELANEIINYGGLIWGNASVLDKMISIAEEEARGGMTHAAARRARASATSSAVQNNALFLPGNVQKARQRAKAAEGPTSKKAPPKDVTSGEVTPQDVRPQDLPPKEVTPETTPKRAPAKDVTPRDVTPAETRPFTVDELKAKLPADLQRDITLTIDATDPTLEGDTVHVEWKGDKGLISEIRLRCGAEAHPDTVARHADTIRTMQKYQGFAGRVRRAISRIADVFGIDTIKPENKTSFEAMLEVQKLPGLIADQMQKMAAMRPVASSEALAMAEGELASLMNQLDKHLRTLQLGDVAGEGAGYVAKQGLSKAKQKQYAALQEKLRGYEKGSDKHRDLRWEMYQLTGGDLDFPAWKKVYEANIARADKANVIVKGEHARVGWGETEQTIKIKGDEVRRLDIANVAKKRGMEVKAYESEYITDSPDITDEIRRDAILVKRGWEITWLLIDTEPSGPLLKKLLDAGINVEIRLRNGLPAEVVTKLRATKAKVVRER